MMYIEINEVERGITFNIRNAWYPYTDGSLVSFSLNGFIFNILGKTVAVDSKAFLKLTNLYYIYTSVGVRYVIIFGWIPATISPSN